MSAVPSFLQLLEQLYSPGEWFQVNKSFPLVMEIDEAVFFSYLCGVSRAVKAYETADGWFFHTHVQIENELHIPKWAQDRLIKSLKYRGFITTELRGIPAKRYFKLNLDLVHQQISQKQQLVVAKSLQQGVTESLQHNRNKISRMRNIVSQPSADKKSPDRKVRQIDHKYLDWAKRLERIISNVFKTNPDFHLIKWANQFRSVHKKYMADDDRINRGLDSLEKNGHEFPITCPKHFGNQLLYLEQSEKKRNSSQGKLCENCGKWPAIVLREGNGGWLCKNCKEMW